MARIELQNIAKSFQVRGKEALLALRDVNLQVHDSELLVVLGPSGCGKTTLLRMIAGLEEPTDGTVLISGRVMNEVPAEDRHVAMVFQQDALLPHMTVSENIGLGLRLRKVPKSELVERVHETAKLLSLTPILEREPGSLSGGERQRVALARAIVQRPTVFLFDEPLSQLDATTRLRMRREIVRVQRQLGATTIYVTHDQAEALAIGHRIAVLDGGIVQQIATATDIYQRPANLFVAQFIGSPPMNLFQGIISAKGTELFFVSRRDSSDAAEPLVLPLAATPSAPLHKMVGSEVVLGIRPEHLLWVTANELTTHMLASVEAVEPTGPDAYVHLTNGQASCVMRARPNFPLTPGSALAIHFDMQHAHVFDRKTGVCIL
jgi:multiple sugar transport system ATP-binding protein